MRLKQYLSYSQYSTFLQSKETYIKRYIDGVKLNSPYLDFGKLIAEHLEDRNKESANEDISIARRILIEPKEREKEIRQDFYKIPLYGKLDGFDPDTKKITEYKTGIRPWKQSEVDKAEQITFYAILISLEYKIPIETVPIELIWLETFRDIDDTIHLSGHHRTYHTKRTQKDIINIYPKIKKVWKGIEELINSIINV